MRLRSWLVACAFSAFAGSAFAGPTLVAEYKFNGDLTSSVAGAPALTAVDPDHAASFGSGGYTFGGASNPADQGGLVFNSTGLLTSDNYSVQMTFTFNSGSGWRRLLDVQNRQSDQGFYVNPSSQLDVFDVASGGGTFAAGQQQTVLLTVNGTTVTASLNGTQAFSTTTNIMDISNADNPGNLINVFLDNSKGGGQDEWSSGTIRQLEFFNNASTAAVPEPATWALLLLGVGALGGTLRVARRGGERAASALVLLTPPAGLRLCRPVIVA